MEKRKCIALLIAMQVTFLCYSQTRVQSRDVKRLAGKAYLLSKGVEYEIREKVVLAQLKAGKEQVRDGIKVIKNHSFGMLEIAVPDSINTEEYIYILEKTGDFESVENCKYEVPSYTDIGGLYCMMVLDCAPKGDEVSTAIKIFSSPISDYISDFNSDCYYQNPSYLEESFKAGKLL